MSLYDSIMEFSCKKLTSVLKGNKVSTKQYINMSGNFVHLKVLNINMNSLLEIKTKNFPVYYRSLGIRVWELSLPIL